MLLSMLCQVYSHTKKSKQYINVHCLRKLINLGREAPNVSSGCNKILNCGMVACNACYHSSIKNFHILAHGNNDFYNNIKEALYIRKHKHLLNEHLHQHGAPFTLNVF